MSGGGQSQVSALSVSLADLPHLPRTQMVELWIKHLGRPPPKAASTPLLLRAVAYAVQEQQFGGLKRQELRLLHKTAQPGEVRANVQKAPNSKMREGHKPSPSNGEPRSMQRLCLSPKPFVLPCGLEPGWCGNGRAKATALMSGLTALPGTGQSTDPCRAWLWQSQERAGPGTGSSGYDAQALRYLHPEVHG